MPKKKAAFFYDYPPSDGDVFGQGRREKIAALTDLYPHVINAGNFDAHADKLSDIEVIFGGWGIPNFTAAALRHDAQAQGRVLRRRQREEIRPEPARPRTCC